jgi:hypothetical protein
MYVCMCVCVAFSTRISRARDESIAPKTARLAVPTGSELCVPRSIFLLVICLAMCALVEHPQG